MMHRISNLKELKAEKKRICEHQKALEGAVKNSWHELRNAMKPANLVKELWSKVTHR